MDINALTNTNIINTRANFEREQSKTDSFKSTLEKAVEGKNKEELKTACKEFEAYFIQTVYKELRKSVDTSNSFIKKSNAENIFQDLLDEENSKSSTNAGGIGLADMMYKQMSKNL